MALEPTVSHRVQGTFPEEEIVLVYYAFSVSVASYFSFP